MKKKNDEDSSERDKLLQIDVDNSRFPYAIVWTPIVSVFFHYKKYDTMFFYLLAADNNLFALHWSHGNCRL